VARDYGADEVMIVTITWDHAARRRSYELIANAFGLDAAPHTDDDMAMSPLTAGSHR